MDLIYKTYSKFIPVIGKIIVGEKEPYEYLIRSIENFVNQDELIDIINNGRVIFNKSVPKNKPCGIYFIKSGDLNLNIINCENEAIIKIN